MICFLRLHERFTVRYMPQAGFDEMLLRESLLSVIQRSVAVSVDEVGTSVCFGTSQCRTGGK